jgi:peptide/nickel transport system substrate-binding protein
MQPKTEKKTSILAKSFTGLLSLWIAHSAVAAPPKEELKIGITQDFDSLNPLLMNMAASTYLYNMVGRALMTLNPEGKWVPQMAKSIPSLENGQAKFTPDKKKIVAIWEIKDNVVWGDGTPVTCADFQFSREVAASPNVSIAEKETYTAVEKIEWDAKNPKKCTFTYDKARWDFYQLPNFRPLPKHVEEPIYKKYGSQKEGYEKNTEFSRNPSNPGLYTGPYRIKEFKLGSHVELVANDKFFGKQPQIKKIIVKLIPNTGTLEANLRSGTIDKVSSLGFSFDQALAFEKKVKAEKLPFSVTFKPGITYEHIDFNLENPILKDVKVRQAMIHSLNREELVTALFEGRQSVANHFVAPIDPWYTVDPKKVKIYNFSRREAGRLLDEAGWKMNKDDGFRYKDGKKLSLQFMTTAGNKTRETVQSFLKDQWKAVGIEVVIKNEPAKVFFGETTKKRKYGGLAMYAWVSSPESNPRSTLHCSSIPTEKNGWSGQNQVGFCDPKMDSLIDSMALEFDGKKRAEIAHQMMKIYTEQALVIPLYYRADIAVRPEQLSNFRLAGHQFSETNEIENWDIK